MIRKFILPVIAAGLLAGCVTPGYQYSQRGDYYHGRASVGAVPYGSVGYGTRGGFYGSIGYGARYGYGYPYGAGYGPYGYYPYGYSYYPGMVMPWPGHRYPVYPSRPGAQPPRPDHDRPPQRRAPWRDMDGWRADRERGEGRRGPPRGQQMQGPMPVRQGVPNAGVRAPQPAQADRGGAMRQVYRPPSPPAGRSNDGPRPTREIEP